MRSTWKGVSTDTGGSTAHRLELAERLDLKRPAHDEEQVCDAFVAVQNDIEQVIEVRFLHGGSVAPR